MSPLQRFKIRTGQNSHETQMTHVLNIHFWKSYRICQIKQRKLPFRTGTKEHNYLLHPHIAAKRELWKESASKPQMWMADGWLPKL